MKTENPEKHMSMIGIVGEAVVRERINLRARQLLCWSSVISVTVCRSISIPDQSWANDCHICSSLYLYLRLVIVAHAERTDEVPLISCVIVFGFNLKKYSDFP